MKIANYEITNLYDSGCDANIIQFQFDSKVGIRLSSKIFYDIFKNIGMWNTISELEEPGKDIAKIINSSTDESNFDSQKMHDALLLILNKDAANILLGKNTNEYLNIFIIKHLKNNDTILDYEITQNKTTTEQNIDNLKSKIKLYLKNYS